jgi:flagellar basal body-associated protein FliL
MMMMMMKIIIIIIIIIIVIIIIIIIIPITIMYSTLFQIIFSPQIFPLKFHMHFLPLHCYMSGPSPSSFDYMNNIHKIKVNDMGANQDTYESNAIPAQTYYSPREFQESESPKF